MGKGQSAIRPFADKFRTRTFPRACPSGDDTLVNRKRLSRFAFRSEGIPTVSRPSCNASFPLLLCQNGTLIHLWLNFVAKELRGPKQKKCKKGKVNMNRRQA